MLRGLPGLHHFTRAAFHTSASTQPPPIVPAMEPSSRTSSFADSKPGLEPLTSTTVARAHFCPRLRRRRSSSNTSIPCNYSGFRQNELLIGYAETIMSATPILDLEQVPPARRRRRWARWLPIVIGAAIGFTLSALDWSPDPDLWPGFNPILWFIGIYVTIAIHELAHLGVGMWRGMDPGGLIIGGFRLMRSGDRWTLRVEWKQFIIGGMAMPMSTKDTSVADFVWMVAARPDRKHSVHAGALWIAFLHYGSGAWDWIGSFFWGSSCSESSRWDSDIGR